MLAAALEVPVFPVSGTVPVYTLCPDTVITRIPYCSQKQPSLDDGLCGLPNYITTICTLPCLSMSFEQGTVQIDPCGTEVSETRLSPGPEATFQKGTHIASQNVEMIYVNVT